MDTLTLLTLAHEKPGLVVLFDTYHGGAAGDPVRQVRYVHPSCVTKLSRLRSDHNYRTVRRAEHNDHVDCEACARKMYQHPTVVP